MGGARAADGAFRGGVGQDWAEFGEDEEIVLPEGTGGHAFLQNWKRLVPEESEYYFDPAGARHGPK